MTRVFHYTFGHKMPFIAHDGQLIPTSVNISPGEKPVLWFSLNEKFEPTAAKAWLRGVNITPMTFDELHEHLGIYRFMLPLPDERVYGWRELQRKARIPPATVKWMVEEGIRRGAKPTDWYGSFVPVPLDDMKYEAWDGSAWVEVPDDE